MTITRAPARGPDSFADDDSARTTRVFRHPRWRVSGVTTTRVRVVR